MKPRPISRWTRWRRIRERIRIHRIYLENRTRNLTLISNQNIAAPSSLQNIATNNSNIRLIQPTASTDLTYQIQNPIQNMINLGTK